MNKRLGKNILVILSLISLAGHALGSSSCSATNENGDQRCSISCQAGQSAVCIDGTGSSSPTCECQGSALDSGLFIPNQKNITITKKQSEKIEKTDILQVVNSKLNNLNDYHISTSCKDVENGRFCYRETCINSENGSSSMLIGDKIGTLRFCSRICEPRYERVCEPVLGKLQAKPPIAIEKGPTVVVQEPNWKDIPSEIIGYRETYLNCTPAQQSFTFKHGETLKVGARVSKGRSIDKSLSLEANVSFSYTGIGGGRKVSFNQKVNTSEVEETSSESTKTLDLTLPVIIPPNSKVVMDHYWIKRVVPVHYTGTVIIDTAVSDNQANITRLSQVLTTAQDREFEFSGTVTDTSLSEGSTKVNSEATNKEMCSGGKEFEITSEPYHLVIKQE